MSVLRERKGAGNILYITLSVRTPHASWGITVRLQELGQVTWASVTPGPARTSLGPKMLLLRH